METSQAMTFAMMVEDTQVRQLGLGIRLVVQGTQGRQLGGLLAVQGAQGRRLSCSNYPPF